MKLRIEKAVYGGAGLARHEGKAVFVPMALPGELVKASLNRDKGSFAEASLLEVLESSPARVGAPCPYYGACGGCQYQHAAYPEQLAMKQAVLLETLSRAGLRDLPELEVHTAEPWGYRNRIRLHLDPNTHALGYRRRGSHQLLPVDHCPIAAPLLQTALRALQPLAVAHAAGMWCAEIELFSDGEGAAVLLSCVQRAGRVAEPERLKLLCESLRERLPELAGAALFQARPAGHGARSRQPAASEAGEESASGAALASWGEPRLHYRVGGRSYRVSAGSFFQGNRFLTETLLSLAVEGEPAGVAWDLFAGVGLFAGALAGEVTAVEGAPGSSEDLRQNLAGRRVVESSTLAFLKQGRRGLRKPDRILLDPPRAGLGQEGSALLASVHSQYVTYVSCDPATLARDLRVMVDAGYTISRLHLIDMFPQTFHLETVAKLRLR